MNTQLMNYQIIPYTKYYKIIKCEVSDEQTCKRWYQGLAQTFDAIFITTECLINNCSLKIKNDVSSSLCHELIHKTPLWSKTCSIILRMSLFDNLPLDIINIIDSYCVMNIDSYSYTYKIPIYQYPDLNYNFYSIYLQSYENTSNHISPDDHITIIINAQNSLISCFTICNMFMIAAGMCGLRYST